MSLPLPPVSTSLPWPPTSRSLPAPPLRLFAVLLPVSRSLKLEPARFSTATRVSEPEPPVAWAVVMARLTLTALAA
ncbi:hypothetical protein D3C81_2096830 [compost metagenome]